MITLENVSKTYEGVSKIVALRNVSIEVKEGEFLVILGPSGAGKSTLMRCINRLVVPTGGRILLDGREVTSRRRELRAARRDIGMVFQQFNLVKRLSVLMNVLSGRLAYHTFWPSLLYRFDQDDKRIAIECLTRVNMEHKAFQRADTLSGGEQQRVAIARALAQEPKVILADEPVASLDPKIARQVLTYLKQIAGELGITVLCNLHQVEYAREYAERVVGLSQGTVVFDGPSGKLTDDILQQIYYRDPETADDRD
ncbi:MAG: phosphonate ABC transporter ATP-binding protein [Proteobacteria bacterium]|nr:phosphonate ABC transporter ATP-binding protein [Pseudomonadota bacterium]MCH8096868.1 phosphonate ABC transporter ATP-binding protein [Pseudomonadota bacterium]